MREAETRLGSASSPIGLVRLAATPDLSEKRHSCLETAVREEGIGSPLTEKDRAPNGRSERLGETGSLSGISSTDATSSRRFDAV